MSAHAHGEPLALRIEGLELAAKVWGPPDGLPMLALHGWLDSAASFDHLAPLLTGVRVVALDLPGHGGSDHHPAGMPYAFVDLVAEVAQALDALGWDRCVLMGHSLGAGIASVLAGTLPERVQRLVLIEALGPLAEEPDGAPRRLAESIRDQRARQGRAPPIHADRAAAARRLVESRGVEPGSAATLVGRGTMDVEGGVTWCTDPKLRIPSRLRLSEAHVEAFLRRIECPTLLVRALAGLTAVSPTIAHRRGYVRDLQYEELEGGHHVHLDAPGQVAALVQRFLAPVLERHA